MERDCLSTKKRSHDNTLGRDDQERVFMEDIRGPGYALITPARNESKYIELTLKSVVEQTVWPVKWVIVSDGSTDGMDDIVESYVEKFDFIHLVRRKVGAARDFGSKIHAFNCGLRRLGGVSYRLIGNLDGDVSFEPDYFERVLREFSLNSKLGIAGGVICELGAHGRYWPRPGSRANSVAGAVQLFRKECFEEIGGYSPLKWGGVDTIVNTRARMLGWETRELKELEVCHYRRSSTALGGGILAARAREGRRDYCLGYHPAYEVLKILRRTSYRPFVLGSCWMALGYFDALFRGEDGGTPTEVRAYLRREQLSKMLRWPNVIGKRCTIPGVRCGSSTTVDKAG